MYSQNAKNTGSEENLDDYSMSRNDEASQENIMIDDTAEENLSKAKKKSHEESEHLISAENQKLVNGGLEFTPSQQDSDEKNLEDFNNATKDLVQKYFFSSAGENSTKGDARPNTKRTTNSEDRYATDGANKNFLKKKTKLESQEVSKTAKPNPNVETAQVNKFPFGMKGYFQEQQAQQRESEEPEFQRSNKKRTNSESISKEPTPQKSAEKQKKPSHKYTQSLAVQNRPAVQTKPKNSPKKSPRKKFSKLSQETTSNEAYVVNNQLFGTNSLKVLQTKAESQSSSLQAPQHSPTQHPTARPQTTKGPQGLGLGGSGVRGGTRRGLLKMLEEELRGGGVVGVEGSGEGEGDLGNQNLVVTKLLNMQKMKNQLDGLELEKLEMLEMAGSLKKNVHFTP